MKGYCVVPLEDRKHLRRTLKVSSPLLLPGFSASFDKWKKGLFTFIVARSVDCVYFCKTLLQIKGFPAYIENRSFSDIQDMQYFYVKQKRKASCNTICTVFSLIFFFKCQYPTTGEIWRKRHKSVESIIPAWWDCVSLDFHSVVQQLFIAALLCAGHWGNSGGTLSTLWVSALFGFV